MTTYFDRYTDKNVMLKWFSKVEVFRNVFKGASKVVYYHKDIIEAFVDFFSTSTRIGDKKEERKKRDTNAKTQY